MKFDLKWIMYSVEEILFYPSKSFEEKSVEKVFPVRLEVQFQVVSRALTPSITH